MATARAHTQLSDVLPLVVQHCAHINTKRDLCSLLQVSSSCRLQLQQSRGACMLDLRWYMQARRQPEKEEEEEQEEQQDSRFVDQCELLLACGRWLLHHAGLASALRLSSTHFSGKEQQVLQQLLAAVLQSCRLPTSQQWPACTPAAAIAAAVPAAEATAGTARTAPLSSAAAAPQLQLRRVESYSLLGPVLLQALAATGLQDLTIFVDNGDFQFDTKIAAFCSGLSCATSLCSLHLRFEEEFAAVAGLWPGIRHLTGLTSLMGVQLDPTVAQQLPPSLQVLQVSFAIAAVSGSDRQEHWRSGCTVDLRHLTGLTHLRWEAEPEPLSACLPANLEFLSLCGGLQSFSGGTGLQHVQLWFEGHQDLGVLQSLSCLCRPWELSFSVSDSHGDSGITADALQLAAATLGTATALTGLGLYVHCSEDQSQADEAAFAAVKWCQHLVKLPSLRELSLLTPLTRDDLLHLTALTGLRLLSCSACCCLDDFAAASLATALTGLTRLTLASDDINSVGLLPVLALLTGLQSLEVTGGPGFQVQEVEKVALSRLTQLTSLQLEGSGL